MSFDFNGWTLFFGFASGTVGLWLFKRARERANFALGPIAVALLIYPYFVSNPWASLAIGTGLCLTAYKVW